MDYLTIKYVHMTCVSLSGCLLVVRGIGKLTAAPISRQRWINILPHLIDTMLLISAVYLMVLSGQYPFAQSWLTAKVCALLIYIGFGTMALKRAKTKQGQLAALIVALVVFCYIGAVAITKQVLVFF